MTNGTPVDLDDVDAIEAADPGAMLRAAASSAAQVREAVSATADVDLAPLVDAGRPRAVVCVGMGGSGIAGDVLRAVTGPSCPVPVVVHKDFGLPGWVGVSDLVVAVSCSGSTEETISATAEAVRRGAGLFAVGGASSPLEHLAAQARAPYVLAPGGRQPRASLWSLAVPVLLAADRLGLVGEPLGLEETAARLEQVAAACHVGRDTLVNPAKALALDIGGRIPQIWGASALSGVAAYRFACQLNENAKLPAAQSVLPEAVHNQIVAYDGPFAPGEHDIFADPDIDGPALPALLQILLRDPADESPGASARATVSAELAAERGLRVRELTAEGATRAERLASLIGLADFATVYAGIAAGLDPTPVDAITYLKTRTAR